MPLLLLFPWFCVIKISIVIHDDAFSVRFVFEQIWLQISSSSVYNTSMYLFILPPLLTDTNARECGKIETERNVAMALSALDIVSLMKNKLSKDEWRKSGDVNKHIYVVVYCQRPQITHWIVYIWTEWNKDWTQNYCIHPYLRLLLLPPVTRKLSEIIPGRKRPARSSRIFEPDAKNWRFTWQAYDCILFSAIWNCVLHGEQFSLLLSLMHVEWPWCLDILFSIDTDWKNLSICVMGA